MSAPTGAAEAYDREAGAREMAHLPQDRLLQARRGEPLRNAERVLPKFDPSLTVGQMPDDRRTGAAQGRENHERSEPWRRMTGW
jgi:hypothetical protein